MMDKKIRIDKLTIKKILDDCPDTSTLGEYTDKPDKWAIVREGEHQGKYIAELLEDAELPGKGREYRFFIPYAGGEEPGSDEYKKYGLQDYRRMEGFNNGDWSYIGIRAEAEVSYEIGQGNRRIEDLTSGGLWGIESDSGGYLKEVANEELADLKRHLETFGVSLDNFDELAEEAIGGADI